MRTRVLMTAAAVAWLAAMPAYAQDATWLLNPVSGNYNSAANWTPATVPTGTAFFGTSINRLLTVTAPTVVSGWTFNVGASAYTFTNSDESLQFNGAGVVVNGGSVTINNTFGGVLQFFNASTAGYAIIDISSTSSLNFNDTSTAANASITNSGILNFNNDSRAGSATITNNAILDFSESSSAGSATIINPGNSTFRNNSSAANTTITNRAICSSVTTLQPATPISPTTSAAN